MTLVTGPTDLQVPSGAKVVRVESAQDMLEAVLSRYPDMDVVIKTAAVADYRPKKTVHSEKMKKRAGELVLELERTTDILKKRSVRKKRSSNCSSVLPLKQWM
ncbi:hypothetical protein GCM10020331_047030 [Ectobacillus funiculus]